MQVISIRLFEGAYARKPKAEQRAMLLAAVAVMLQLGLLVYLAVSKQFTPVLVLVFLFNLLVPAYFFFTIWLDSKPRYRRHLTLAEEGVCYRSRFLQKEHAFDWEEVDSVHMERNRIVFVLKNEEEHCIILEHIQDDDILQQVKEQIKEMVQRKEVMLH
jgi:hypothetical protein